MEPPHDPSTAFRDAVALARQGKYEEALEKHIWFHEHALEYDVGFAGVRLSYAMSAWLELAEKYPKARQALVRIRDGTVNAILNGTGTFHAFQDLAVINDNLKENQETVALFKTIHQADPDRAKQYYRFAEPYLVTHREFSICSSCLPDVRARFEEIRHLFQMYLGVSDRNPGFPASEAREFADEFLTAHSSRVVQILVAVGRRQEAEQVFKLAVALSESATVHEALIKALR